MAGTNNLVELAQKIAIEGPHKYQTTPRRVRGLLNGKIVFDAVDAYHVWEHAYYPQFYVPASSFTSDSTLTETTEIDGTNGTAHFARLAAGNKSTERVIIFNTPQLDNLVKIDFKELDQWFEEDVPIYQHPKDPYKRVDILTSSRPVRVALDGVTLAESPNPLFLFETLLRTRYYLPQTSVKWEYLTKSETETYCPYKGKANYYNININGKVYNDLVWYYVYPTAESAPVAGHLCFYNEKVDIWVDGVQEKR